MSYPAALKKHIQDKMELRLFRFTLKPTREGIRFILIMLLVMLAAFNTANNLIYLIVAMMLSVLALSLAALWLNLRGLALDVEKPTEPVFAKRQTSLRASIQNGKKRLPAYSVKIKGPGREGSLFPFIPAGRSSKSTLKVLFPSRGLFRLAGFSLESSFPFIFFDLSVKTPLETGILVYPEMREVTIPRAWQGQAGSAQPTAGKTPEAEPHAIRQYQWGDDMRRISWKATARYGRLMMKDSHREGSRMVTLFLDGTGPPDAHAFEKAVSYTASLAEALLERDFSLRLVTSALTIPFGSGRQHLYRVLDHLAVVKEGDLSPEKIENDGETCFVLKSANSPLRALADSATGVFVYAEGL